MTAAGGPQLIVGFALIAIMAAIAAAAPLIAPYDPTRSSMSLLAPPSWSNWLGTDELGRDIWSRLLYGARPSLLIGFGAATVAAVIGAPIGLTAGYFRGAVDIAIVPIIDLFIALPGLVLALIITVMVGPTLAESDPRARLRQVADGRPAGARPGSGDPRDDLHRGRAGDRRRQRMDHLSACLAEHDAHRRSAVRHHHVFRDLHVGEPELPRAGHSAADPGLGRHGARRLRFPGDQSDDEPGDRAPPWPLP